MPRSKNLSYRFGATTYSTISPKLFVKSPRRLPVCLKCGVVGIAAEQNVADLRYAAGLYDLSET